MTLPEGLTQQTLIPLAAFLLEYPVGYIPVSLDQKIFLSSTPLDVYECTLTPRDGNSHALLKFSCPCSIGLLDSSFSAAGVQISLQRLFGDRIEELGGCFDLSLQHHVEQLDRVGL